MLQPPMPALVYGRCLTRCAFCARGDTRDEELDSRMGSTRSNMVNQRSTVGSACRTTRCRCRSSSRTAPWSYLSRHVAERSRSTVRRRSMREPHHSKTASGETAQRSGATAVVLGGGALLARQMHRSRSRNVAQLLFQAWSRFTEFKLQGRPGPPSQFDPFLRSNVSRKNRRPRRTPSSTDLVGPGRLQCV